MNIAPINPINFNGNVILQNVVLDKKIYGKLDKISKKDDIDILIAKGKESRYLKKDDSYIVTANKNIKLSLKDGKEIELSLKGLGTTVTPKSTETKVVSDNIFESALIAIDKLGYSIARYTGKKPNFLKHIKK